jgi:hypothetical protein
VYIYISKCACAYPHVHTHMEGWIHMWICMFLSVLIYLSVNTYIQGRIHMWRGTFLCIYVYQSVLMDIQGSITYLNIWICIFALGYALSHVYSLGYWEQALVHWKQTSNYVIRMIILFDTLGAKKKSQTNCLHIHCFCFPLLCHLQNHLLKILSCLLVHVLFTLTL